ncbi:type II secretion system F family protein [Sinomonas halotolerans]|uniref:Type II secretion system F family protein n=1 Tax=Sinomonas halotolerans TaxID=1644133 RepID=A0ABU9WYF1_9MICC
MIPLAAALLVALPAAAVSWSLLANDRGAARAIRANLTRGHAADPAASGGPTTVPLFERLGRRFTPESYIRRLDRMLSLAGRPASLPLGRVLAAKPALGLAGLAFGLLMSGNPAPILKLMALFLVVFGYFIPDLLLYSKGTERQKAIQQELPNIMDQLLISVEAGLGFEAALSRAGSTGTGAMAEELVRTLQDMQVGRSRRDAYLGLAERTTVPEVRSFVQAVIQADEYGIAIGRVLRVQAKSLRLRRRQRAEQQAMKLPVKVLFPLLFFIFPVLFIALLGPAVINTIAIFSK